MKERRKLKKTKVKKKEGRNENNTKIWGKKRRRKNGLKRGRKGDNNIRFMY